MAYHVLARKWRPRAFADLVGQEPVVRALVNALDSGRLHHALLFTGTRGVGKTSLARIYAKALNCERGVSSLPCGDCRSCRDIDEGRFVDLIEVDAASRTGVDDTRELLDNVQYAPARGRFKVYLIDEVHMFSRNSFNALLKTLEEPPEHVKFLLATTEPRRLPVTVLSRCLQFNLRSLAPARIAEHLGRVLEGESVVYEPAAAQRLARAANGSLRDALSLLDQAIAHGAGQLTLDSVDAMLGGLDQGSAVELLQRLAAGDAAALLRTVAELDQRAPDYESMLADLITLLQRVAVAQVCPAAVDDQVAPPEQLRALARLLAPEDLQLYYQIGLIGRRDLPLAPEPRAGFEMILLRMLVFRPRVEGDQEEAAGSGMNVPPEPLAAEPATRLAAAAAGSASAAPQAGATTSVVASRATQAWTAALGAVEVMAPAMPPSGPLALPSATARGQDQGPEAAMAEIGQLPVDPQARAALWESIFEALELDGVPRALASHCLLTALDQESVTLQLERDCDQLRGASTEARLGEALCRHYGRRLVLRIELGSPGEHTPAARRSRWQAQRRHQAEVAIAQDPNVGLLRERFGATIAPNSVTPTE
jgi:DNA polymerase-3 subunit gamma/tau